MGLVAERMAATMSMPQAQLGLIRRRRGPDALQDYPDGTARTGGKIEAKISLGPAYARPAAEGHDPIDKYVGAGPLIAQPTGSGFTRLHEGSARPTMGEQMMHELGGA
jgi:hypothetical protein